MLNLMLEGGRTMKGKLNKLTLILMTSVLLLMLGLGPLATGAFAQAERLPGQADLVVPCDFDGGGSGSGG
jgi:hypothetical protein